MVKVNFYTMMFASAFMTTTNAGAYFLQEDVRDRRILFECQDREYINEAGECTPCFDFQVTSRDGLGCVKPACGPREAV